MHLTQNVPMASFIGSILSTKDNPTLIIGALQLVDLLLGKLPAQYRMAFRREGVLHDIEVRAGQDLTTQAKPPTPAPLPVPVTEPPIPAEPASGSAAASAPTQTTSSTSDGTSEAPPANPAPDAAPANSLPNIVPIPVPKRSSSSQVDPQDAIILRCRIIRFKYLMSPVAGQADDPFETMQVLAKRLSGSQMSETEMRRTLGEIAALFSNGAEGRSSISSFELMKSGLVDELLDFATTEGRKGASQIWDR